MITFIGPDIILSDLTEGPTLFAQSDVTRLFNKRHISRLEYVY